MFERRLYYHIDWLLLIAILALCGLGMIMIYSVTATEQGAANASLYRTQLSAIVLGLGALAVCLMVDYRTLADKSHLLYIGTIGLLIYVLVFGVVMGGARRWISLGAFNLQPSELAKISLSLVLASYFAENRRPTPSNSDLLVAAGMTALPVALIAIQPDLGTAVTLLPVYLGIVYVAGLRLRIVGVLVLIAALASPVVWAFGLKDYQKTRISTFLAPERDPRGTGYQQIQARITVGSGGLWGKGFTKGTQAQLGILPVAHNDFIFSALGEEQGFAGVLVALGLYLFVIVRGLDAARMAKDRLGAYLVMGVISVFTFQVVYNITMSAGLAPVKGLTLPLMSYGGSSMIATLAAFGLVLNVRMRRFTN